MAIPWRDDWLFIDERGRVWSYGRLLNFVAYDLASRSRMPDPGKFVDEVGVAQNWYTAALKMDRATGYTKAPWVWAGRAKPGEDWWLAAVVLIQMPPRDPGERKRWGFQSAYHMKLDDVMIAVNYIKRTHGKASFVEAGPQAVFVVVPVDAPYKVVEAAGVLRRELEGTSDLWSRTVKAD